VKKEIALFLKKLGIIGEKDTGNIEIHLNDGAVSKIYKRVEVK
jgi:hypothetical protein